MKTRDIFPAAVAGLITLVVFAPAGGNGFVNWDDNIYVVGNSYIKSLDAGLFSWAFTDISHGVWIPLTWISFAFDYAVWGLNPFGYHIMNIILHAANTALVCLLAMRLLQAYQSRVRQDSAPHQTLINDGSTINDGLVEWFGLIAALLFGLHPLRVESVAWISERKDLLSGFFGFLTVILYIDYAVDKPPAPRSFEVFKNRKYLAAMFFFVLSLMSKPMTITLPLLLVVLDWFPLGRLSGRAGAVDALREKALFFLSALAAGIVNMLASTGSYGHVTIWSRMITAGRALITYLLLTVRPEGLAVLYDHPGNTASLRDVSYLAPAALLLIISALALATAGRQKIWLAVWSAYLITLLPTLGIFTFSNSSMNDRYTYFAAVWPTLAAALCITVLYTRRYSLPGLGRGVHAGLIIAVASALLYYAQGTMKQIRVWHDTESLWSNVIDKRPAESGAAHYERGCYYYDKGRYDEALRDEDAALEIVERNKNKRTDNIYFIRGRINMKTAGYKAAVEDFTMAIERNPYKPMRRYYEERALAYKSLGMDREAAEDASRAEGITETN